MLQITYISTVRPGVSESEVLALLQASRRNNGFDGITGLLIYDGKRFLQALEGEPDAVMRTYDRICADPLHRAVVQLSGREVAERQFGNWNMAWQRLTRRGRDGSVEQMVDELVAGVPDKNTRALFSSFARVRAQAA